MMKRTSQYIMFFFVTLHMQTAPGLRIAPFEQQHNVNVNTDHFNVAEWQKAWDARLASFDAEEQFQELSDKAGHNNLCIDGHLAPEFYLIGAQKAGTTSFSAMLAHPNMVRGQVFKDEPFYYEKEMHIFDNENDRFLKGKQFWLSHFPECPNKMHKVAADMTPNYLFAPNVPERMQEFYGDQSHRIKFTSILRNPVGRIQSSFHFYQAKGFCDQKFINAGFKAYVEGLLNDNHDPCGFVEQTKYHEQLATFMQHFNSSQFLTIPMLEVVAPSDGKPSSRTNVAVLESLGLQSRPANIVHINHRPHPSVLEDLGETLLEKFQSFVDEKVDAKKVAQLHIDYGIKMFGYSGDPKDATALADYLKSRW